MTYFDYALIPLRAEKLAAYRVFSEAVSRVYREYGALRVVDSVLDEADRPGAEFHAEGAREALDEQTLRRFPQAAAAEEGEIVILSVTEWPDKATREAGLQQALADPRLQPKADDEVLFEGRRLVAGGFRRLFEV